MFELAWRGVASGRIPLTHTLGTSALDGSAPIRGGIPIVFPVFGAPSDHPDAPKEVTALDKHGFARNHNWTISTSVAQVSEDDKVAVTLELKTSDRPDIAASWPFDTLLQYTVTLDPNSLRCQLSVTHLPSSRGDADMPFQALLHNYLLVPDSTKASVKGLQGIFYIDKLRNFEEGEQLDAEVHFNGQAIDRTHVGKIKSSVNSTEGATDLTVQYNAGLLDDPLRCMGKGVEIKRSAELRDTTVWNPAKEGEEGINDLQTGDYKHFVCVEPGAVRGFQKLAKGAKVRLAFALLSITIHSLQSGLETDTRTRSLLQWQAMQTLTAW